MMASSCNSSYCICFLLQIQLSADKLQNTSIISLHVAYMLSVGLSRSEVLVSHRTFMYVKWLISGRSHTLLGAKLNKH